MISRGHSRPGRLAQPPPAPELAIANLNHYIITTLLSITSLHPDPSQFQIQTTTTMRKFVKFLGGGEKHGSSYHSIWATPAPESGSRAVVENSSTHKKAKAKQEWMSTEKPKSKTHISKLNQPSVAELASPTGTTMSRASDIAQTEPAELEPTEANIAEMDACSLDSGRRGVRTVVNIKTGRIERTEFETSEVDDGVDVEKHGNETENRQVQRTEVKRKDLEPVNIEEGPLGSTTPEPKEPAPAPAPAQEPEPEPEPEPTPKPEAELDPNILIFQDDLDVIPAFGRPFGIASTSIIREPQTKKAEPPKTEQPPALKSPEDLFKEVDKELDALLMSCVKHRPPQEPKRRLTLRRAKSKAQPKTAPEACIICLELFAHDGVKAPDKLSQACLHPSSVCYACLAKSIKNDLETRFWDEIRCPECKTLFIHEDIRRFADDETFNRYDKISFRHAVNADKNFIWCLECDFGQLHEPGADQPLVRCLNCSAESCFKHAIKWHDGFTCDEYDAVLWDPDSYKAIREKGGGNSQRVARMSKKEIARAAKNERSRQQKLHEALKEAAKKKQKEEARRLRDEKEIHTIQAEAQAAVQEEDVGIDESYHEDVKDDFKEKIEQLKKRMREVELSMQKVEQTTKRCPGCQWPIEKNDGCDHMTCIKCRREFCWICLGDWQTHTRRCRE
ncbi:hypothetical protein BDV18DRAFT_138163 [Aspergillus unguis]